MGTAGWIEPPFAHVEVAVFIDCTFRSRLGQRSNTAGA